MDEHVDGMKASGRTTAEYMVQPIAGDHERAPHPGTTAGHLPEVLSEQRQPLRAMQCGVAHDEVEVVPDEPEADRGAIEHQHGEPRCERRPHRRPCRRRGRPPVRHRRAFARTHPESPVSRILYGLLRGDHLSGAMISHRLDATDPGVITGRDTPLPLYAVLLRTGFGEPALSPTLLVGSYPTVSPLPAAARSTEVDRHRPLAVFSLFHFPWTHAPRGLPGVLPYGVRTFLTSRPRPPPKWERRHTTRDHL